MESPNCLAWPMSLSSSRWDFHFHSYVLTIYVRLYWILELVVFYSLVCRGCIRKVSVQLVPKHLLRVCSTDSFLCSERKHWKKTRLKQGSKKKEGKSKRCCRHQSTWLIIALLSHHYWSAVAPISLRCCSVVAPLSHRYCSAIAPPLFLRCRAAVAPLLHRYCSTVVLLLSLLLLLLCQTAIAPLSHRCRTAVAPTQRGYK